MFRSRIVLLIRICVSLTFGLELCSAQSQVDHRTPLNIGGAEPFVLVLGIAQDGGYPQAGCRKRCCEPAWVDASLRRSVVSLAVVDPTSGERWLFECTPDFKHQLRMLDEIAPPADSPGISGIFLTHAHIGHYVGLLNLGREVLGARSVPTYVMPRMQKFLSTQGPWKQLVELDIVKLIQLQADVTLELNERIAVTPILVPHRDEFSETVAYRFRGPRQSVLFLPDIDKWDRWERKIESELEQVDVAYLDATFFDAAELPDRNMREIPHPFAVESIERFADLSKEVRNKIRFIHLNHSNPLLDAESSAARQVKLAGMHVAQQGERVGL